MKTITKFEIGQKVFFAHRGEIYFKEISKIVVDKQGVVYHFEWPGAGLNLPERNVFETTNQLWASLSSRIVDEDKTFHQP